MSWSILAIVLHTLTETDLASFASLRHDSLPAAVPPRRPLPKVRDVLAALRESGTHGDYWFTLRGDLVFPVGAFDRQYLGEVSLHSGFSVLQEVDANSEVTGMSFRKGSGSAIRGAIVALAKTAGDFLVFDDVSALVVGTDADPTSLAARWPFAP